MVINDIEEKFGCNLEDLKEIRNIIYNAYKNKFSATVLHGDNDFSMVVWNSFNKDKNAYMTLTEKCIRRKHDLYKLKDCSERCIALEEALTLTDIIETLIPSEIFWAMEEEYEDGYMFSEHEQLCFDYLKTMAMFYLDKTKSFEEYFEKGTIESQTKKLTKKDNK